MPEEPPAKRAKTAEVRLSSTNDVSMTEEGKSEKESSEERDSSSGSNSDFSSGRHL